MNKNQRYQSNLLGEGKMKKRCIILFVIAADGVLGAGPTGGGADIIGGTGVCSGIQGKIDFMPRPAVKASKQGTYQGIGIGKVSWKIP
jgi:hypothetical protein